MAEKEIKETSEVETTTKTTTKTTSKKTGKKAGGKKPAAKKTPAKAKVEAKEEKVLEEAVEATDVDLNAISGETTDKVEIEKTTDEETTEDQDTEVNVEADLDEWLNTEEESSEKKVNSKATGKKYPNGAKDYSDKDRKKAHIGVVCGKKEMDYVTFKKGLDIVLWSLPPWEYEHKIFGVKGSWNYRHMPRYCAARKREFQPVPLPANNDVYGRLRAYDRLVRLISKKNDVNILLVYKCKNDPAMIKLVKMAKARGIEVRFVEY